MLDATRGWSPAAPRCSSRTGRRCCADADRVLRVDDGRVTELTPPPTGQAPR